MAIPDSIIGTTASSCVRFMRQKSILLMLCWGSIQIGSPSLADTAAAVPVEQLPSITVTGSGEVLERPDMARVNIGVVTHAQTAADALKTNTGAVEKLLAVLGKRGIEETDIQTSSFSISPQYDYDRSGQPPRLTGYSVSNQVRVAVRRIAELGALLDEVVTAGANQINAVTFDIDEAEPLKDNARRLAIRDARRKAELYAQAAGVRLGGVLEVTETGGVPVPQFRMAAGYEATAVPIAPGELTIRQDVIVRFAIDTEP